MSGIISGVDASNVVRPILVDSSGRILLSAGGTIWQYKARYAEEISVINAPAGLNVLNGSTVPAGEIWVVESLAAVDTLHIPTDIQFQLKFPTYNGQVLVDINAGLAAGIWKTLSGKWTLAAGDFARVLISGVTLNDTLIFQVCGYKMGLP